MRRTIPALTLALAALAAPAVAAPAAKVAGAIPARPEKLVHDELKFEVPDAAKFRHELPGGVVAYVVEDHALPLVKLSFIFRTGAFREPEGRTGLAALTAAMLRKGGTKSLTPEQFDEKVDFLAAEIASNAQDVRALASLDVITPALAEGLDLFFEMLTAPRFDEARLEIEKGILLEGLKQRNDDAGDIVNREWGFLLRGEEHFAARQTTASELAALTGDELAAFHRRTYGREHLVLAISGDVDAPALLADLERRLAGWQAGEPDPAWPPTGPEFEPAPGLYQVEKDIPQGKVRIGHLGAQWKDWADPRMYALMVMNDVLGGGGFTSRLTKRIRSDEGLAYGAYSGFGIGTFWPGVFVMGFDSKSPTVAYASEIALEELGKIRTSEPSEEEMRVSKNSFIDTFPRSFETAARIANTFANDEVIGRAPDYWANYRDRLRAVTAAEVRSAAEEFLRPDRLVMLVVGRWEEIAPGDPQGRATMAQFFEGKVKRLPPRDPLTLEPRP